MKILVTPPNEKLEKYYDLVDGFILGIAKYSLYTGFSLDFDELQKKVLEIKDHNLEVFVMMNRLIKDHEVMEVEETLKKLMTLDIDGVLYDDIGIYQMAQEINFNHPLVMASSHKVTNSRTINYWGKEGVKMAFLSPEITLDEILLIRQETSLNLMVTGYGFLPMFTSPRKLLSNFHLFINREMTDERYYLYEKETNGNYPIVEDKNGCHIYSASVLNGIPFIKQLSEIDYLYMNGIFHGDEFLEVVRIYKKALNEKDSKVLDQYNKKVDMVNSYPKNSGFFNKETIFKLKSGDK